MYFTETRSKTSSSKGNFSGPGQTIPYDNLKSPSGPLPNLATRPGNKNEYKTSYLAPNDRSDPLEINVVPASPSTTHKKLYNIEGKKFIVDKNQRTQLEI